MTHFASCHLLPTAPAFVASSRKILCAPFFLAVNRSPHFFTKPSDPQAADSLPRETFRWIMAFQTALVPFESSLSATPEVVAVSTEVGRVRFAIGLPPQCLQYHRT